MARPSKIHDPIGYERAVLEDRMDGCLRLGGKLLLALAFWVYILNGAMCSY